MDTASSESSDATPRQLRNRASARRSRRRKAEQFGWMRRRVEDLETVLPDTESAVPFARRMVANQALRTRWAEDLARRPQEEREQCIAMLRMLLDHLEFDAFVLSLRTKPRPSYPTLPETVKPEDFFDDADGAMSQGN